MSQIYKTGVVSASTFIEPSSVTNEMIGTSGTYTPTTGTNSCMNMGRWMVPDGTVGGDQFYVKAVVDFNGFDTSNTSGTFRLLFQGANWVTESSSQAWQGTNHLCAALNAAQSLTSVALSATKGTYVYEALFTVPADWLSTYYGSNVGVRSDYSNGTGVLTVRDILVIPAQYSVMNNTHLSMRLDQSHITVNDFIEY